MKKYNKIGGIKNDKKRHRGGVSHTMKMMMNKKMKRKNLKKIGVNHMIEDLRIGDHNGIDRSNLHLMTTSTDSSAGRRLVSGMIYPWM